ncbi:MAG: Xaa-Pro dipeptidyl-peptidase [Bacteroidales bacterium]
MKYTNRAAALVTAFIFLWPFYVISANLPSESPQDISRPVIEDGMAQKVEAFSDPDTWIRHDLWVETDFDSDGDGRPDRMHVSVTRPPQTEEGLKLPVVYESSPYYAGGGSLERQYFWDVRQELYSEPNPRKAFDPAERNIERPVISNSQIATWVPYGYIVVHSSAPGTGYSQGCPTMGALEEALAPKAVIDWLNGNAKGYTTPDGDEEVEAYWTTGKVGMTGTSYNGTLAVAAATTGVEGLEAIIPVAPNTSYYHYYRADGLIVHPDGYLGEDIDFFFDYTHSNPDRRDYCNRTWRDTEIMENIDRVTGNYNDFWDERDLLNRIENLEAAVLMSHAFNDWNVMPSHSYRVNEALKNTDVPLQMYYHQGGHGGPPPFEMMNKWFTRYLFEVENDVENDPAAWIVREHDDRLKPTPYEDFPNPAAVPVEFFLAPGAPGYGSLTMERKPNQGIERFTDNFSFSGSALAQAEFTDHRLLYLTGELEEDLHLSGVASVNIRLAIDKPAANLSVWLVSLPWNEGRNTRITDNIITRGWADPQNRNSIRESEPLPPGTFYRVGFEMEPTDQVIPAGQKIGLMIFSSDKNFTLHPDPGTELTIDLNSTSITLPVVGGEEAIQLLSR